jgi:hypothetical protein
VLYFKSFENDNDFVFGKTRLENVSKEKAIDDFIIALL